MGTVSSVVTTGVRGVVEVGEVIGRVSGDANKNKQRERKSANLQHIQSS